MTLYASRSSRSEGVPDWGWSLTSARPVVGVTVIQYDARPLVNSITVEDIQQIVAKQLDKAKKGDETAAKFIISQIVNGGPAIKMSQTNIITDPKTAARIARGES